MSKQWKNLTIILIIVIIVVAILIKVLPNGKVTGNAAAEKQISKEPIKVGVILPLTGDLATYAEGMRNSINLAIEEEKIENKINLIFEDDKGCDSAIAVSAAQKLVNADGVKAIIGPLCSSAVLSIAPITEPNKIIIISPAATSKSITNAGNYLFRTVASDADKSVAVTKFAYNQGYKKAALLYDNAQDSMLQQSQDVEETFKELGGEIVIKESFQTKDKDFRTQLTKIKNSNADVIFIGSLPVELDLILKQAKTLDIKIPIIVSDTSADLISEETKKISEGLVYPFASTPTNKEYQDFIDLYNTRYGKEPTAFSAESYDAAVLLTRAILKSDKSGDDIKKKLQEQGNNYYGASGIVTFDSNGDVIKPITIKMIRDGKSIIVKEVK